ncbi:hypothetical protein N7493_007024 [Penicillium malachiteum]|uniref:Uncharacterized protein n=1 Tax=Penicillium malachiteum TaxID=1324776 RepID=A0AAD6MV76_9EURO|nr:hypothetical protein N7493_007024 [Penicillium malachiteum]
MSKIASAMYRFQSTNSYMAGDRETTMQLVRNADNNLADVIAHLPSHLQPTEIEEEESNVSTQHAYQPLSVVLFYYRMFFTRVQRRHQNCPYSMKRRATLVCLDSAHAIVKAYTDPEQSDYSIPVWYVLDVVS